MAKELLALAIHPRPSSHAIPQIQFSINNVTNPADVITVFRQSQVLNEAEKGQPRRFEKRAPAIGHFDTDRWFGELMSPLQFPFSSPNCLRRGLLKLHLLPIVLAAATLARGDVTFWDLGTDFSAKANPSGAWSFGKTATIGSPFQPFKHVGIVFGGIDAWSDGVVNRLGHDLPSIAHNGNAATFDTHSSIGSVPAGVTILHPGLAGALADVRWTAPAAGTYIAKVNFSSGDTKGATTHSYVQLGRTTLAADAVDRDNDLQFVSTPLALGAGDTLDFLVDWGNNGNYFNDSTILRASVVAVIARPADRLDSGAAALAAPVSPMGAPGATDLSPPGSTGANGTPAAADAPSPVPVAAQADSPASGGLRLLAALGLLFAMSLMGCRVLFGTIAFWRADWDAGRPAEDSDDHTGLNRRRWLVAVIVTVAVVAYATWLRFGVWYDAPWFGWWMGGAPLIVTVVVWVGWRSARILRYANWAKALALWVGIPVGLLSLWLTPMVIQESQKPPYYAHYGQLHEALDQFRLENPERLFINYSDVIGPTAYLKSADEPLGEDQHDLFPLWTSARIDPIACPNGWKLIFLWTNGARPLVLDRQERPIRRFCPPDDLAWWLAEQRKPDGVRIERFPDGSRAEVAYRAGWPDGPLRIFAADNHLEAEATYVRGRLIGPCWRYRRDGTRFDEAKLEPAVP